MSEEGEGDEEEEEEDEEGGDDVSLRKSHFPSTVLFIIYGCFEASLF